MKKGLLHALQVVMITFSSLLGHLLSLGSFMKKENVITFDCI